MTYTTEQLEKMLEPHNGVFTYETNKNYDLRNGPVVGHVVRFSPTPKDIGDGLKSFGWTFPICAATDFVSEPDKVMSMVADALNAVPALAAALIAAKAEVAKAIETAPDDLPETPVGDICNHYGGLSIKCVGGKPKWSIGDYNGHYWVDCPVRVFNALAQLTGPAI